MNDLQRRSVGENDLKVYHLTAMVGETRSTFRDRIKIVMESGEEKDLNDPQLNELIAALTNSRALEPNWLHIGVHGSHFLTREGHVLPLVIHHASIQDPQPPCIRRQPGFSDAHNAPIALEGTRSNNVVNQSDCFNSHEQTETLHCLIDQSSSMRSMADAVYEGAFELLRAQPQTSTITMSFFATDVTIGQRRSRDDAIADIERRVADGTTALYDGIVAAVDDEAQYDNERVTLVIVTDGMDTSSRHSPADAKSAIQRFEKRGQHFRVLFMGSNQDAISSAATLGISSARALSFGGQHQSHMRAAFRAASENTAAYRSSGQDNFTLPQRQRSVGI